MPGLLKQIAAEFAAKAQQAAAPYVELAAAKAAEVKENVAATVADVVTGAKEELAYQVDAAKEDLASLKANAKEELALLKEDLGYAKDDAIDGVITKAEELKGKFAQYVNGNTLGQPSGTQQPTKEYLEASLKAALDYITNVDLGEPATPAKTGQIDPILAELAKNPPKKTAATEKTVSKNPALEKFAETAKKTAATPKTPAKTTTKKPGTGTTAKKPATTKRPAPKKPGGPR